MNPKERVITALKRQIPDEVPVSLSIGPTNALRWVGNSDWRAVFRAHQMVGSIAQIFSKKWVYPELFWLSKNIKAGKYLGFHSTGKVRDILPIMIEAKPDFVLRFESPRFGGDISLGEAKQMYGDHVCLMGGYDPHFFVDYSLDEMCKEAKRCIDEAAGGGGYILATTDAIPERANWEDIKVVVETAKEYGRLFLSN